MNIPEDMRPMERLVEIMRLLRSDKGCPWDREQDLHSLKTCLLEECHELLEAIDRGDPGHHKEELGDVLLQVVFQAQIRDEEGAFDLQDVAGTLCEKLIRRHPHVFGNADAETSGAVLRQWEAIKARERADGSAGGPPASVLDGVPPALPALHKAHQIQRKAARVGFDWKDVAPVLAKVEEELDEIRSAIDRDNPDEIREEIGDLLFSVANLSRFFGENAELSLHRTIDKFMRRFRSIEQEVHRRGKVMTDFSLEELDHFWEQAKTMETAPRPHPPQEGHRA